jgi:hypothetical protein
MVAYVASLCVDLALLFVHGDFALVDALQYAFVWIS